MANGKKELAKIKASSPTVIDKLAGKFFPKWAASREQARFDLEFTQARRAALSCATNWTGSSKSRTSLKGWTTTTGGADAQNNSELPDLRERSLDLLRNNPIAAGALNNVKTFVVGDRGPRLNSQLDGDLLNLSDDEAKAREALIQREFSLYFNNREFDLERSLCGSDSLSQTVYTWFASGDSFTVRSFKERKGSPYGTKWQNVEAGLCTNPDRMTDGSRPDPERYDGATGLVYAGIERDESTNEPIAYYFQNMYYGDKRANSSVKWTRIPAFDEDGRQNVIHLHIKDRPRQSRGVAYLAPIIEPLKQLGRYTEGELMAAVVSGLFTVFVKSPDGRSINPIAGSTQSESSDDSIEMGFGNVVELKSDEDINTATPGRPSENFDPFVESIFKQIGMALGQPKEVLVKHFQSSYSAARAAMMEAWRYFKTIRGIVERNWLAVIHKIWFEEAVARSRVPAPGYIGADEIFKRVWEKSEWVWPAQGMIRPEVETKAYIQADEGGYATKEHITAALNGGDYYANASQRRKEARTEREIESERVQTETKTL